MLIGAAWVGLAVLAQVIALAVALRLLRRRWERYDASSAQIEAALEAALSRLDERIAQAECLLAQPQPISQHGSPVQEVAPRPRPRPSRTRLRKTQVEPPEAAFKAALSGRLARRRTPRASDRYLL